MTAHDLTVVHIHEPGSAERAPTSWAAPGWAWECSCGAASYGWEDQVVARHQAMQHRAEAAEAALAEMQGRLDARAADLGRQTQATLVRIKALEAGCVALAAMQAAVVHHRQQLQQVGHTTPEGHQVTGALCLALIDQVTASPRMYVTKAGTVLTDPDLDGLVAEAERGYCTAPDPATSPPDICGHALPCPEHQ